MAIKFGSFKLNSRFILAPMAGVSDLPFRLLNREFGAELAFVEMINCRSVSYNSKKTRQMLSTQDNDKPLGIQILGSEPKFIKKALDVINTYDFQLLDFNAACPARKVVRRNEGAALLKEPAKLSAVLKIVVRHSKVPVTIKIRSGWDKDSINAPDIAKLAQDCGVSAVFLHGRTRMDAYKGTVDYEIIRKTKEAIDIPLIASGDLISVDSAVKMLEYTGCDCLNIARGALGNPWIFHGLTNLFSGLPLPEIPSVEDVCEVMCKHLDMCVNFYGEKIGVVNFRKFFSWYTKGFRKVRSLREKASLAKTKEAVFALIRECARNEATKKPHFPGVFCR